MDKLVLILLLLVGIVLSAYLFKGKGLFLIAGFNMIPKQHLTKINQVGLCKFMGKVMVGICVVILLILISNVTGNNLFHYVGLSLLLIIVVFSLVWTTYAYLK
ncbi:DUF3784 domain-containing protein [Anaerorhabdus sp.]|uniref:DUF3784 domain-containing protein n=1 Tax=Anaerorhabdus sp. TaxID=1872524 RepID=UPI002FC68D74